MTAATWTTGLPPAVEATLAAMRERYACKLFDPRRSVAEPLRRAILEAGRLSPSSFGLEPWVFVVVDKGTDRGSTSNLREGLFHACFDQENLRTADFVVTIAVRGARHYAPEADFVRRRAERFPGGLPAFIDEYRGYYEFLSSSHSLDAWARAQGYIPCANMMTVAAAAGVDSCAIEGFREEELLSLLALPPEDWRVSLVVPFGYRGEEGREKIREPLENVVFHADGRFSPSA